MSDNIEPDDEDDGEDGHELTEEQMGHLTNAMGVSIINAINTSIGILASQDIRVPVDCIISALSVTFLQILVHSMPADQLEEATEHFFELIKETARSIKNESKPN